MPDCIYTFAFTLHTDCCNSDCACFCDVFVSCEVAKCFHWHSACIPYLTSGHSQRKLKTNCAPNCTTLLNIINRCMYSTHSALSSPILFFIACDCSHAASCRSNQAANLYKELKPSEKEMGAVQSWQDLLHLLILMHSFAILRLFSTIACGAGAH